MKFRYMFQQLVSHISVIVVAFIILSIVFAHYVGNLVFEEKVEELTDKQAKRIKGGDRTGTWIYDTTYEKLR